jgi:3-oxoacyl-[acyl-carrier-protein] synthase II
MQRRVVITGCGVVTAAGNDKDSFWGTLMRGESCIRPLSSFAFAEMGQLAGAEVALPAEDRLPPSIDTDPLRARCIELGFAAARRAVADSALSLDAAGRERAGVAFGTTMGEERQVGDLSERRKSQGDASLDAGFFERVNNHRLPAQIANAFGFGGPVSLTTTACRSGNAAIAQSIDLVSFGEGAGAVVIESLEHANERGARVLAELVGYGISNDAHHITAPGPHGEGFVRATQQALATSGVSADQISYVSAHGTGTPYNDKGESEFMVTLFGARAKQVPISSIKSVIGHTNGAASAIETVACVLAIEHQAVPPTISWREPDPEFDLDYVPGKGRSHPVDVCLNLAAGFGGHNVCLIIRRYA